MSPGAARRPLSLLTCKAGVVAVLTSTVAGVAGLAEDSTQGDAQLAGAGRQPPTV